MKFALSVAALVAVASAGRCDKLAERLERRIDRIEDREDRVADRIDDIMAKYVMIFNSDDTNSARVSDIDAANLTSYIMAEITAQIDAGTWEASMIYNREYNVGDCDVSAELMDYEDAVDSAREQQDCFLFIADEMLSPIAMDPAAYLNCSNDVFSGEAECTSGGV